MTADDIPALLDRIAQLLDQIAERDRLITALLASRRTYRLHRHGRRLRLRVRDHWQIEGQPAGTVDVVAEHTCGQPLGTPPVPPARRRTADTEVPF